MNRKMTIVALQDMINLLRDDEICELWIWIEQKYEGVKDVKRRKSEAKERSDRRSPGSFQAPSLLSPREN